MHVNVPVALPFAGGAPFPKQQGDFGRPAGHARSVWMGQAVSSFQFSCWFQRKDVAEDTCERWQHSKGRLSVPLLSLNCSWVSCLRG